MDPHSFIARAEAQRWLGIAEKLLIGHDLVGSKTFAIRAKESDPRLEAADLILAIAETLLAAEKRVVGNNGSQQPDYYAILQLGRFVQDTEHIASQFRRLAVLLNPHQNRFPYADQAFQLVNDAWAVLSNPMRKSMYDEELDFPPPPPQQMNPMGFNLEQHHQQQPHHHHHHHHQQQQHNFFSINHMASGHEQELPEPPPHTFQSRVQQSHQQQQLQQHNFLSQSNPVRSMPVREQEHLFQISSAPAPAPAQHRDHEQLFQTQVQPFQITSSPPQPSRQQPPPPPQPQPPQPPAQPQPPQSKPRIQSPTPHTPSAPPQPPFSWPQAPPLSQPPQSQPQPKPHMQSQMSPQRSQSQTQPSPQRSQSQPQPSPHSHIQPQPPPPHSHVQPPPPPPPQQNLQPQQQLQQEQQRQESLEQNTSHIHPPSPVNINNGVREEETEEEELETDTAAEDVDESPTFWTVCPFCFYMYEYPRIYTDCTLRCGHCKRAFQAVRVPSPPQIIEGQDAYFCCWGFFPVGVSMAHMKNNHVISKNSKWTPFSPLFDASSSVQDHLNGRAAPKENFFVNKNSGPRNYIDDSSDDVFIDISEPSDDSDGEWVGSRKENVKRTKRELKLAFKNRSQVLGIMARDARNGSVKSRRNRIQVQEGARMATVVDNRKKPVGSNPRMQSGRVVKELGKLDLNVEFNNNEGEEGVPRVNRGSGQGEEDNIEGIGFFEGLDEFLSSLPILSVVNEEKVKAA